MITEIERRLAEFVDRESEICLFCDLLRGGEKRILMIWGGGGVGKSSLLARMIHECAKRKITKAEVVWSSTRNPDYLAIMGKIRDDAGAEKFKAFADLENSLSGSGYELKMKVESPSSIQVGQGVRMKDSQGKIVGIEINEPTFVLPRSDQAIMESERMSRLTDRFIKDLAEATKSVLLVIFFDAIERMTEETKNWVCNELLGTERENRLPNVRFVLCGRKRLCLDRDTQILAEEAELHPLELEDIVHYLEKRGVEKNNREALAELLLVSTHGNPLNIAIYVDGLFELRRKKIHNSG